MIILHAYPNYISYIRAYWVRNARRETLFTVGQFVTLMKSYHFTMVLFSRTGQWPSWKIPPINVIPLMLYRTWENFGRGKYWRIWQIVSYIRQIFPCQYSQNVFGICTDCSSFTKIFPYQQPVQFLKFPLPNISRVQYHITLWLQWSNWDAQ